MILTDRNKREGRERERQTYIQRMNTHTHTHSSKEKKKQRRGLVYLADKPFTDKSFTRATMEGRRQRIFSDHVGALMEI